MKLGNLRIAAGDGEAVAAWDILQTGHNAIVAKCRPSGQGIAWAQATALELPKTATTCTFTGLTNGHSYDVQISPVQFGVNPPMLSVTPAIQPIVVSAHPLGPAIPVGGWKVVLADGFNDDFPLSNFWGPNAYFTGNHDAILPGPASSEVEAYAESQVSLQSNGLNLEAVYQQSVGGPGKDYKSGVVISQPTNPVKGQHGFPITGFQWLPTSGVRTCFEAIITAPNTVGGGEDPGWWCSTGAWENEIDFFEMWDYGTKPWNTGFTWIYDTANGKQQQSFALLAAQTDQKAHRWTHLFDGTNKTIEIWIDGVKQTWLGKNGVMSWPATFSSAPLYLVISHGLRNANGSQPTWTTGSTVMTVRSVACYTDNVANGNFHGGGIAPGTIVQ